MIKKYLVSLVVALSIVLSATAAFATKPLLGGLVHRQQALAPLSHRAVVNAGIIPVDWSDLQPTAWGSLNYALIDGELAKARSAGQRVKLKVYAGRNAPAWVKNLGGTPPCIFDPPNVRTCYTIPRFWTADVGAAYDDLMTKLAAKYEADPAVATIQASRTGTLFAEPFLRQAIEEKNRQRLLAAGFSIAADEAALRAMIDTHARLFPTTRTDLAVHPYQHINPDGSYGKQDQTFTRSIMDYCRQVLGERCAIGYTGLGKEPESGSAEAQMFTDIAALGHPIWFQTETLDKLGGNCSAIKATLQEGVNRGAYEVELPAGYHNECSASAISPYDSALEARQ